MNEECTLNINIGLKFTLLIFYFDRTTIENGVIVCHLLSPNPATTDWILIYDLKSIYICQNYHWLNPWCRYTKRKRQRIPFSQEINSIDFTFHCTWKASLSHFESFLYLIPYSFTHHIRICMLWFIVLDLIKGTFYRIDFIRLNWKKTPLLHSNVFPFVSIFVDVTLFICWLNWDHEFLENRNLTLRSSAKRSILKCTFDIVIE